MEGRLFKLLRDVEEALAEADVLRTHPQTMDQTIALSDIGICLDKARLALRSLLGFGDEAPPSDDQTLGWTDDESSVC